MDFHHLEGLNIILTSRAVIPNRPAYGSNPTETAELQRQVDDLLARG